MPTKPRLKPKFKVGDIILHAVCKYIVEAVFTRTKGMCVDEFVYCCRMVNYKTMPCPVCNIFILESTASLYKAH